MAKQRQAMWTLVAFWCIVVICVKCEDNKWVWSDEKLRTDSIGDPRYQIYERPEHLGEYESGKPFAENKPSKVGFSGHGNNAYPGILVGPDGPTGIIGRPHNSGSYKPEHGSFRPPYSENHFRPNRPTVLRPHRPGSGRYDNYDHEAIPSWVREDPRYREYDTCRCRYSFNCPSTGLKFGSCSRDKRYCCYNSQRYPELSEKPYEGHRYPYRPQHNHGPVEFPTSSNSHNGREPQGHIHGNYDRPSYGQGYGSHTNGYQDSYDRPYDQEFDVYARSVQKNDTVAIEPENEKLKNNDN